MSDVAREAQNVQTIAVKEFMDNVKSRRFVILGVFYFALALLLTLAVVIIVRGPPVPEGFRPDAVLGLMNNLNIVLALLAVIVSADTLSLEKKDRTIFQLISKPVERSSVIVGKFIGCLAVVATLFTACALFAYVLTAVLTGTYPVSGDIPFVLAAIVSMVLVLAVYVAIGVLASTITGNPFISIIGSLLAWVGLWFSSAIGNMIGYSMAAGGNVFFLGDPFNEYPIYAKAMVWVDPLSHGMMSELLSGAPDAVVAGLPLWANLIFVLAYTGVLLVLSIMLFDRQDLS